MGWEAYLLPGETILWEGRPATAISWRGGEMGTVLLGGIILAFIGFFVWDTWNIDDWSDHVEERAVTGLMIFAAIGLLLAASGPLAMQMVRRGTWYTLTSRRAIIAHWPTLLGVTVYRGLDCYAITEVGVVPSDVRGLKTTQFARLSGRHTFIAGEGWRRAGIRAGRSSGGNYTRDQQIGFERIEDAEHVAELCRKVQADPTHGDWLKSI